MTYSLQSVREELNKVGLICVYNEKGISYTSDSILYSMHISSVQDLSSPTD